MDFIEQSHIFSLFRNYAYGLHFVVVCCSVIAVNFTYIHQGFSPGIGVIIWLPQYRGSNPEEYEQ